MQSLKSAAVPFSDDDWCPKEAMQEVGFKPAYEEQFNHRTGVWDGMAFCSATKTTKLLVEAYGGIP